MGKSKELFMGMREEDAFPFPNIQYADVCINDNMQLYSLIPQYEHSRVFSGRASAEIACDCLVCGNAYFHLPKIIPHDWIVIDFGCGYNAQSYLFSDHKKYIGVDIFNDANFKHYQAPNTDFYNISIQEFIQKEITEFDLNKTMAIVHYVPDSQANELVRKTFKNVFVFYPSY